MLQPPASLGAIIAQTASSVLKREQVMADDFDPVREKREMRAMWIFSAGMVLLILGIMGVNMLVHHETSTDPTEMSSQSRVAPPNSGK